MHVEISGHSAFVRETDNRAVLNKDRSGLIQARARKRAILERDARHQHLEDRVTALNTKIDRIEKLLLKLIDKGS